MKKYFWLILIVLLAAFLRLWKLNSLPLDTHVDEVMNAYVGNFTLKNGTDLYGNKWPILYFNNFGDYPNILPMYLSGLGILLFGNNEFGMRAPIALFGIVSIILAYFVGKLIFQKKSLALFAAFSLAIFPWHIILSRATAEGITASTVFLLGIYLLLRNLKKQKLLPLVIAWLILLSTYLLYPAYRIIVPLALLPTFLLSKDKKTKIFCIVIAVVSLILTFMISQTAWGTGRFEQTSLFSQQSSVYPLQAEFIAGEGHENALKARVLYNKAIMFGKEFIKQYASYFSIDFLFASGGLPMRYFVPDQGLWYYSYLLLWLIFIGLALLKNQYFTKSISFILPTKDQRKYLFYFIYLLLLSPLSAALTIDDVPNVHRATLMPLILSILSGLLLSVFYKLPKKKIIFTCFMFLVIFESFYFFNKYAVHAGKFQQVYRSPAMKNLAYYLAEQKNNYDSIYIERKGETAIYYLFYNQIYDSKLNQQFQTKLQIPQVESIHFTKHECVYPGLIETDLSQKTSLFIVSSSCYDERPKILEDHPKLQEIAQIKSSQGDAIFKVYQFEATNSAKQQKPI